MVLCILEQCCVSYLTFLFMLYVICEGASQCIVFEGGPEGVK